MDKNSTYKSDDIKKTENGFKYVPSSSEKKRAVMMYLFFGIMVYLTKKQVNSFEYYHLKQSSWRRILFLLILVFDVVLLFLPIIKYLWLIPLIVFIVAWILNVKQAWDWKYFVERKDSLLAIFSWVWWWFIELFELDVNVDKKFDSEISAINDFEIPSENTNSQVSSQNSIEADQLSEIESDINNQKK